MKFCVEFINVTNIHIARPREPIQRATFSGHNFRDALKMQVISLSNGLVFNSKRPAKARRHDIRFYNMSNLKVELGSGMALHSC